MSGAKWFSKLDASHAFRRVKLSDNGRDYTTFNTPFGRYAYYMMPYGVCSVPELFHKVIEQMFENIDGVRVYMDDLLVWGSNEEEHDRRLAEVQKCVLQYGLLLNHDKCVMKQNTISFLCEIL